MTAYEPASKRILVPDITAGALDWNGQAPSGRYLLFAIQTLSVPGRNAAATPTVGTKLPQTDPIVGGDAEAMVEDVDSDLRRNYGPQGTAMELRARRFRANPLQDPLSALLPSCYSTGATEVREGSHLRSERMGLLIVYS